MVWSLIAGQGQMHKVKDRCTRSPPNIKFFKPHKNWQDEEDQQMKE
jgi:hypothetical protein